MKRYLSLLIAILSVLPMSAKVYRGDVRIAWDYSTARDITSIYVDNKSYEEQNLIYPRIKRLSNGNLMMSFMTSTYGLEPYVALSSDDGATWHDVQRLQERKPGKSSVGADTLVYVNPDFIELADGRIMLAYQCRWLKGYSDLDHTNENCYVEIMFSSDKGKSWGKARRIYTGRCWEPAMLQLPSGEIQMYITDSNEVEYKRSQPCTIVIRSFDNGKTWQGKQSCSYLDGEIVSRTIDERGSYDGMPSAVRLNNGDLVMPLEVWSGVLKMDQTPIIVRTDSATNWTSDQSVRRQGGPAYPQKRQVNKDLWAYGPYMCRLDTGEPVIIASGKYKGHQGMWTVIGDKTGTQFSCVTCPFQGYWGSIDNIGNDRVLATSTVDYKDSVTGAKRHMVKSVIGRVNRAKSVAKNTSADVNVAAFNRDGNDFWFLGKNTGSCIFTGFGYTDRDFIITAYLFDEDIEAYTPENSDAPVVLFARADGNGDYDTYKVAVNALGKYRLYREDGTSWMLIDEGTVPVDLQGTVNISDDKDVGFGVKLPIPWDKIGGAPHVGEKIPAHIRHIYRTSPKENIGASYEETEGENSDYPQEWLKVQLN
jgi:hypothetical protein